MIPNGTWLDLLVAIEPRVELDVHLHRYFAWIREEADKLRCSAPLSEVA